MNSKYEYNESGNCEGCQYNDGTGGAVISPCYSCKQEYQEYGSDVCKQCVWWAKGVCDLCEDFSLRQQIVVPDAQG